MKPENDANTQIRFKYEDKYTNNTQKDKKYTNTKIQTRTNTNFAIGTLSQIRGGGILDLSKKKSSRENGRNFCSRIISKALRVPKRVSLTG